MLMTPGKRIWARNASVGVFRHGIWRHACSTKTAGPAEETPIDADAWDASHQTCERAPPSVLAILQHIWPSGCRPEMEFSVLFEVAKRQTTSKVKLAACHIPLRHAASSLKSTRADVLAGFFHLPMRLC